MEVHFNNLKFQVFKPIVTIGTFDGVHKGHQSVIERLKQISRKENGESVVISFEPHPQHIVGRDPSKMPLLNTLTEKIYHFEQLGIDHLLILSFTPELANLSYQVFFEKILLSKLNIHTLLVGYDHKFGKNREGDFKMLSTLCNKHGIKITQTPKIEVGESHVSSSSIRKLIKDGELSHATKLLSYNYSICGKIIHGDEIGRKIGFPTANIAKNNPYKLTPKIGVYAVRIHHNETEYIGMLNIGVRPSINTRNEKKIEVHIFDFHKEIYDETIKITFIKRIRDEHKFENILALQEQLHRDMEDIKYFFKQTQIEI